MHNDHAFLVFGSTVTNRPWSQVRDIDFVVSEFAAPEVAFTRSVALTPLEELALALDKPVDAFFSTREDMFSDDPHAFNIAAKFNPGEGRWVYRQSFCNPGFFFRSDVDDACRSLQPMRGEH